MPGNTKKPKTKKNKKKAKKKKKQKKVDLKGLNKFHMKKEWFFKKGVLRIFHWIKQSMLRRNMFVSESNEVEPNKRVC